MTSAGPPRERSAPTTPCPDAETLSRFIDGELPPDRQLGVTAHASHCPTCGQKVEQMHSVGQQLGVQSGHFDMDRCPDCETLVAHLAAALPTQEGGRIEAHVLRCDKCVHALSRIQRRLQQPWDEAPSIPPTVVARATAYLVRPPARKRSAARRTMPVLLRLPVLLPAAFAAGALLFLVVQSQRLLPGMPAEQSRGAAEPAQTRRLTLAETLARVQPKPGAAAVASVPAGVAVKVEANERGWSRVVLPDGQRGWLPPQAFE